MFDPFEYLMLRHKAGLLRTDFVRQLGKVSYHVPCHLRVQNLGLKTRDVLQAGARHRGRGDRALLGAQRHLRREAGVPRHLDEDRAARVQQGARRRRRDHYASDCPMAGHQIESGARGRQAADASADPAAHGVRTVNMDSTSIRDGSRQAATGGPLQPRAVREAAGASSGRRCSRTSAPQRRCAARTRRSVSRTA